MMEGLVLWGTNNLFLVLAEDGKRRLCSIKGKRIKDQSGTYNALSAGDRVEFVPDPGTRDRGLVIALRARRNVFGRFNEKGRAQQSIAANVDLVVCVSSPRLPPFRPRFVDRVAVLAEAAHVPLLVLLNKADLGVDEEVESRLSCYESLGYGTLRVSAKSGEGLDSLRRVLSGLTSVFAGQSGVGKSSLLNALEPGLTLRTAEVSEKFDRGKHTTTMGLLLPLADGVTSVIDTPGVRRLALRDIEPDSLVAYFPELATIATECVFGLSCTHSGEEGCRITGAVEAGEVNADRYESYLRIREELESTFEYRKPEGISVEARRKAARRRPRGGNGDEDDE